MQTRNRFFTDIARVASSAAGGISGLKEEIERTVRQRVELFLTEMNLANREEFDALKSMVSKLRIEQEQLNKKISTL